ncbi:uncharacterized protein LTR77_010089 [Saxophila tyrrhenica]|uniref:Enoyl reductase (ER) domain-containing protein n=1 Tax=Saxophila tyrrhenica TaxID=1690608 RepID=A0AAV9P0R2_9PEZI|nr:hypothetical protein LTR77_010089 [Saxophila tyrrhenica]
MPKQAIIQPSTEAVEIIEAPIPAPQDRDVVIKVVVTGTNPKDWKYPFWKQWPHNSGDDIAGFVHAVGKDVYEFKPGDRVAALHQPTTENGSFAEYAVAPDWTTSHLPHNVSFEEGVTIPVAAGTAIMALFADMKLPMPFMGNAEAREKRPLLIFGVTSAVGAFAAKLARLSGVHPIIGTAGRAKNFASSLVDHVVDYRQSEEKLIAAVEDILSKEGLDKKVPYIFDAISEGGTLETTLKIIKLNGGVVSTVLPPKLFARDPENFTYPPGVIAYNSAVVFVHLTHKDFGYTWFRYLGRLLQEGKLSPHPHEVVPGGLIGVLKALQKLRDGHASAVKYVCRVEETAAGVGLFDAHGHEVSREQHPPPSGENIHPLRNFPYPVDGKP